MSAVEITPPFEVFPDTDGDPLQSGSIYIGQFGLDPEVSPVTVYWDEALTIPAAQPIRTLGGMPSRSGSPSKIYIDGGRYSILVRNKNGSLVHSDLNVATVQASLLDILNYGTFADLLAVNPTLFNVGTVVNVTGDKIAGQFKLVTGVSAAPVNGIDVRDATYDTASRYWTRVYDGAAARMYWFNAAGDGAADDTAYLAAAAYHHNHVILDEGGDFLVDDIPTSIEKLTGGGKLSYTTVSAFPGDTYIMDADLTMEGVYIECRQRNRLAIQADSIKLVNVTEVLNTADTAAGAYTNVNWIGTETLSITAHTTVDTGLKINDTGRLTVNGALIQVNNAGLGVGNGINDGTDGIKISTGSGTISDVVVIGCSRDVIDGFVSSGSLTISNIESDTFAVNGIELKVQDGNTADESPFDINISNVTIGAGGLQNADNFAGLLVVNSQSAFDKTTAPRRINISNVVIRAIGAAQTSGQYYGAYIDGAFEVNLNGVALLQCEDYGVRIAENATKVNISNSFIHGKVRAISMDSVTDLQISNSVIGEDEETGDVSPICIFNSGTSTRVKIDNSKIVGQTNSIRSENTTIDQFKASNSTFISAVRIDNGTLVEFSECDVFSHDSGVNAIAAAQSAGGITYLKFTGGSINDGSRGISYNNLTRLTVIGTAFRNNSSTVAGTPDENNNVILGCHSESSGSFPAASGNDQIASNIVV